MTDREMILRLIDQGKKMRDLQKRFFSEKDRSIRNGIIAEAKRAEREFDNMIFNIEQLTK
jgi:hypothetical protein